MRVIIRIWRLKIQKMCPMNYLNLIKLQKFLKINKKKNKILIKNKLKKTKTQNRKSQVSLKLINKSRSRITNLSKKMFLYKMILNNQKMKKIILIFLKETIKLLFTIKIVCISI